MTALALPRQRAHSRNHHTDSRMTTTAPNDDRGEIEYALDDLLAAWYLWRRNYRLTRGYSGQDSTCRDYRAPTHWDWKNGAADARVDELVNKAVDAAIEKIPNIPERWNTALQFEAMNLASTAAVWTSPMLPKDREEREVLVLEARNMLLLELRREGVMT